MVDLQDAAGLGGHWPVALLRWHLHEATVVEANGHARHLLGLPPGAPDAWPAWLGGREPAPPGWEPLHEVLMQVDDGAVLSKPWLRLVAGRPVMWQLSARRVGAEVWLVAQDVGAAAAQAAAAVPSTPVARDLLLREVHHRLKNNLQGVSGLLRQKAQVHPQAAPWLADAAAQLQAMAQVYGLPLPGGSSPPLVPLVQAVARSVGAIFGIEILVRQPSPEATADSHGAAPVASQACRQELLAHLDHHRVRPHPNLDGMELHPDQAGALALVLNELMTNAIKHRAKAATDEAPEVVIRASDGSCVVEVCNAGTWPPELDPEHQAPGIRGLGLVRALLPSRGARLEIITPPGRVCARLQIGAPWLMAPLDSPAQFPGAYPGVS